jgi:uncharacterized protein (TIRG00374 family)
MMRLRLFTLLQAGATAVLLAVLFRDFQWDAFRALYARLPLWYYGLSLGAILAGQVMYAWRWQALLVAGGVRVAFRRVLAQYFIGIFLNNFFPSTVGGDAAKVYYLGREYGYGPIAASVVLDRLLGLGLLATLAAAVLWSQPLSEPRYLAARAALTVVTAGFAAAIALAVTGTGGLPRHLERFGRRVVAVAERLQRFRGALAHAVRSPRVWLHAAGTVTLYFLLISFVYEVFIGMQAGAHPGFLPVLMVVTTTSVLSNVPIAVNGLGLREQLHVLLLEPLGVPREVAVAISLLMFAHLLVGSLAGGLLWMRASRAARGVVAG